jgi:3-oxoacyl-[acyl-carrier-protein] synthase-3
MIPTGGHFTQLGPLVQAFAIRKTIEILKEFRERMGEDFNPYFIGHQANLTMLESVCTRAEIQPHRHLYNVDQFGNCGGAGAPSVLSQNWDRFSAGDEISVVVVGSGLTWGGIIIQMGEKSNDL